MIPLDIRRSHVFLAAGLILFLSASCIDRDILNISDSLRVNPVYSIPIGAWVYNINGYLGSLATVPNPSADSLNFENILYPTYLPAASFTSADTFAFNIIRDPSANVKSIEFIILAGNGYPTEAEAQVYFLSGKSLVPADSLFSNGPVVLEPARINGEGIVTEPSTKLFSVTMPAEFIQKLSTITGIVIKGRVNTIRPDIHWVKFFRSYEINLHIGSRIELLYNTSNL